MASYTTTELETIVRTLETRLGSGVASISFNGRTVTYTNAKDIAEALTYFRGLLNTQIATESGTPRSRIVRWSSSKGL
jgi:hypothetical protein